MLRMEYQCTVGPDTANISPTRRTRTGTDDKSARDMENGLTAIRVMRASRVSVSRGRYVCSIMHLRTSLQTLREGLPASDAISMS